jgi:hypothetical protein
VGEGDNDDGAEFSQIADVKSLMET